MNSDYQFLLHNIYWVLISTSIISMFFPIFIDNILRIRFDLFKPINVTIVFFFFFHFIKSVDVYFFGGRLYSPLSIQTNVFALLYSLIGLYSFFLGYYLNFGRIIFSNFKILFRKENVNFSIIISLFFFAIGSISFFYMVLSSIGLKNYLFHLNLRGNAFSGHGILYILMYFMQISAIFAYIVTINSKKKFYKFIGYMIIFFSIINTILIGERILIAYLIFSLLVIKNYHGNQFRIRGVLIIAIMLLSFVIFFEMIRSSGDNFTEKVQTDMHSTRISKNLFVNIFHRVGRLFFPHEEFMLLIDKMPDSLPYQYGKTYFGIVTRFIPDKLFDNKNEFSMGKIFTTTFYPQSHQSGVTYSPGVIGEGYLNFHVIGIIINLFFLGVLYKGIYSYFLLDPTSKFRLLIYSSTLPMLLRFFKGGIVVTIIQFSYFFVPLILASYIVKHRNLRI